MALLRGRSSGVGRRPQDPPTRTARGTHRRDKGWGAMEDTPRCVGARPPGAWTMTASENKRAALAYAEDGISVFPVHSIDNAGVCTGGGPDVNPKCTPGKHPHYRRGDLEHGFIDATTDKDRIRSWWDCWPDANIGMPTGAASRKFVLDR